MQNSPISGTRNLYNTRLWREVNAKYTKNDVMIPDFFLGEERRPPLQTRFSETRNLGFTCVYVISSNERGLPS